MTQQADEVVKGRSLHVEGVGLDMPATRLPLPPPPPGLRPSAKRTSEERERRHRERAIAAWLRDLSR